MDSVYVFQSPFQRCGIHSPPFLAGMVLKWTYGPPVCCVTSCFVGFPPLTPPLKTRITLESMYICDV